MYSYKELYGDDLDGNRGVIQTNYVIEDADYSEILSQIIASGECEGEMYVSLIDTTTEEQVDILVDIKDYI